MTPLSTLPLLIPTLFGVSTKSSDLKILGKLEECGEVLPLHLHLPHVHEVHQGGDQPGVNSIQINKGMVALRMALEDTSQERTGGRQDHLVPDNILVTTGQSDIKEVLLLPQLLESGSQIFFVLVPHQAQWLLCGHFHYLEHQM